MIPVYPTTWHSDAQHWQLMAAIKTSILRRMDQATPGVRLCCVKFLQQVVLVQTPGVVDPRVNTSSVIYKSLLLCLAET